MENAVKVNAVSFVSILYTEKTFWKQNGTTNTIVCRTGLQSRIKSVNENANYSSLCFVKQTSLAHQQTEPKLTYVKNARERENSLRTFLSDSATMTTRVSAQRSHLNFRDSKFFPIFFVIWMRDLFSVADDKTSSRCTVCVLCLSFANFLFFLTLRSKENRAWFSA